MAVRTRIPGTITAVAVLGVLSSMMAVSAVVAVPEVATASTLDGPHSPPGVVVPSATTIDFGGQRTGTIGPANDLTLTNSGPGNAHITAIDVNGADAGDFGGDALACTDVTLPAGSSCTISLLFSPESTGPISAQLVETDTTGVYVMATLTGSGTSGYWVLSATGLVKPFGDASFYGQMLGLPLNAPMVSITATPNGDGSWMLGRDGGVFTVGNAAFYGSTGSLRLNAPVVGMAASPDGGGYLMVAADGGVFAFGDASYAGSAAGVPLAAPIVGMAETSDGGGYWMVGADGGVINVGDAPFYGSAVGAATSPIVGMAATAGPALQLIPQSRNGTESGPDEVNDGRPLAPFRSGAGQRSR